jgi:cytochrome c peroxidase
MLQVIRKQLNLLKINFRTVTRVAFFLIVVILISFINKEQDVISEKLNEHILYSTTEIIKQLDSIAIVFNSNSSNKKKCREHYESARRHYKEIEYYLEYNFPFHSKYYINGPLVNKAELEYSYKTFQPHGFQVLEQIIYSDDVDSALNCSHELALLKQSIEYVRGKSKGKAFRSSTTIDMLRFEIIRIMSLHLSGYDCTINKQNLKETKSILNGFSKTIQLLPENEIKKKICIRIIESANLYLSKNSDYDSFNRLHFIMRYLKPLYEELYNLYKKDAKSENTNYAVNIRQKFFYGESWFNKKFFSVVLKDSARATQQAELGRLLFFDPILSGNNQRACASCHNPANAFGGDVDFNLLFEREEKLKRNTPSLVNSLFQKSFFYDGRSLQLEDQVSDVLTNHKEMFSTADNLVYKLKQSPEYKKLFTAAFENTEDTSITYYGVLKSISEYERTLISLNSPFDKYIRGDEKQLSKDEIDGYSIFSGKALCGSCHFFPLFNGVVPPFYSDNEFEVIGVPKDKLNKKLDADSGRYNVSKNRIHLFSFKTVGLRHLDQTAPYMHNGAYTTLDEVLDFYVKGGGAGLGLDVQNQTLPFDSLQLSLVEIDLLKKFLLCLTDKNYSPSVPKSLPVVNMKGLEIRKVGGNY